MYETIVISGGGSKGFGMLGIVEYLKRFYMIDDIRNYIGCSAGAVLCLMLACKETPLSIFLRCFQFLPSKLEEIKSITVEMIRDFLVSKYNNSDITFQELYDIERTNIVILSFDIDNRTDIYYSYKNTPTYKVIDSIEETISIPIILGTTNSFVDGCFVSPFPLKYCKDNNYVNIIGVYTLGRYTNILSVRNPIDEIRILFDTLMNKLTLFELSVVSGNDLIIEFKSASDVSTFECDKMKIIDLFFEGFTLAENYLK